MSSSRNSRCKNNMKQFKRSLSLVLTLVMLLSMVYIAPAAVNAAASDYISASYAANLSVKTTQTVNLMTYPTTASASNAKYTLPADTMLTVKALHKNTSNTYWYEVLYYNMTLYIDATATTMVDHLTGDVTIANVQSPASLAYGDSFPIKGDISSTVNDLGTITAAMYTSSNITKKPYMSASDDANGKSYSLYGSAVDAGMAFGSLAAGVYTYVVTAEAISYYIDDNDALATSAQTVVLETQQCVVTDWKNPNEELAFGIDVSVWNGSINWSKVKNEVDYVILRIGFETTLDNRFDEYIRGVIQYDIPYGVYIYSYAESKAEAVAEAEFVIDTIRSYGIDPQLPIWFDMEDAVHTALSSSKKQEVVKGFCDTILEAGMQPGLYTFISWFNSYFTDSYYDSLPKWIAQIDGFSSNGTSTFNGGTWMWQYSWEGSISGINSAVDCNYYYAEFGDFTSDTSYLSKCTYYPAHSVGKTTSSVTLRQYPSTSYTSLGTVASGKEVEITGLYKNASGEYWYQVNTGSSIGYISASYITVNEFLYDDLAVIEPAMASNLNVGAGYYLDGNIVSQYNNIYTAHAKVYSGEDTLATPVISSKYSPNTKDYNLDGSTVCDNLSFGKLSAGYYTYEISADVKNYYVSGGSLISQTENVVVWTASFTVGSASITPPASVSCVHNVVNDAAVAATCTTAGLTAGSHCTKCGVVFTAQTEIPATGHSYSVTSDAANCQNYELFHYSCSKCGNKYDISADALAEWNETKPLGVKESLIESKTQYRYADCTSTSWVTHNNGTVQYVNNWPTGFNTSNSLYTKYNKKDSKVSEHETSTTKLTINSDAVVGYLYYHWCSSTDSNHYSYASQSSTHNIFHAYYSTTSPDNYRCDTSDMSYKTSDSSCSNGYSEWFFVVEVYGQNYTLYQKAQDGKEWGNWSAWSDTVYTAVENSRKVETRTLYRYTGAELGGHNYVNGVCTVCGDTNGEAAQDYYLFGYINGADYACEGDAANLGVYKFVNGKLTATFTQDSYVAVKTGDNLGWYMTNGWLGEEATSATLYNTSVTGENSNKLFVPGGVKVTFTLVDNGNDTYTLSYVPAVTTVPVITPKYPTLSFEGEVMYNIYYVVENIGDVGLEDMGLITWNTPQTNGTIENAGAVIPGAAYANGQYMVHSEGIPAKMLADTLYFKVYAKLSDGTYVYSNMYNFSAKAYAQSVLAGNYATSVKALVVAMLNYGAAAQEFFGYKPYSLMNADLTAAQKALVSPYDSSMVADIVSVSSSKIGAFANTGGYSLKYPSVSFDGAFSINYYFTPSKTMDGNMTLYYWDLETYNSVSKLTVNNATGSIVMTPAPTAGEYGARYTGIAAKEIDETIFVAGVYQSGGVTCCTGVIAYSLGAYCQTYTENDASDMQDFAQATVTYGYYAKTYFASLAN